MPDARKRYVVVDPQPIVDLDDSGPTHVLPVYEDFDLALDAADPGTWIGVLTNTESGYMLEPCHVVTT